MDSMDSFSLDDNGGTTLSTDTSTPSQPESTSLLQRLLYGNESIIEILSKSRKLFSRKDQETELEKTNSKRAVFVTEQPGIINGVAKPYQMEGLRWLVGLYDRNMNGILADEMGLGKTFQTISFMAYLKESRNINGPHLVLAPKSTIGNWISEIERFCPSLRALKFIGTKEERAHIMANELDPEKYDVIVTSYEVCCKAKRALLKLDFHYLIIDEAHRIKNESSKLSEVVRCFNTEYRLLITGTPLQNNLKELWALLNFLFPEVFESSEEFEMEFDLVGPKELSQEEREQRNLSIISRLHDLLRPFMLRRSKKDVLTDMPAKNELVLMVPLSAMQKRLYKELLRKNVPEIGNDDTHGSTVKGQLHNLAMQLKKACNHPYLFDGWENTDEDPFGEHLIENSGKMTVLDKLLGRLLKSNSRVLIFCQMTNMLTILEDYCNARGYPYYRLDGTTSGQIRDHQISSFNSTQSDVSIFLLSTRAGGLGINLATADVVILYDSDWNPQVDLQAIDRAHRIGQVKPVHVYRLVHEYTIEEKILERATMKLQLDSAVIQSGKIGQKELLELVQFGAGHIFKAGDEDITDADLDAILNRGQERADLLNKKLQEHTRKSILDFSKSTQAQQLYDYDLPEGAEDQLDRQVWDELATSPESQEETLGEREMRRRMRMNAARLADAEAENERLAPRYMRASQFQDWQFFNKAEIAKLDKLEMELGYLDKEQSEKRDMLLEEGFGDWTKRNLIAFVRANALYSRYDIESIAASMKDKTFEEVSRYSKVFWKRYTTVANWEKYIKRIEQGEEALLKRNQLHQTILQKQQSMVAPWVGTDSVFSSHRGRSSYTDDHDRWLINSISNIGYDMWDELSELARMDYRFQFDMFFRTRVAGELSKRADYIIKHIIKDVS